MVSKEIKTARVAYFDNKFREYRGNMRKTWSLINEILKPGSLNRSCPINLIDRDVMIEDPIPVANKLNDYFCSIGSEICGSFSPQTNLSLQNLCGNYPNSFFFSPVYPSDVIKVINSLKNKFEQW